MNKFRQLLFLLLFIFGGQASLNGFASNPKNLETEVGDSLTTDQIIAQNIAEHQRRRELLLNGTPVEELSEKQLKTLDRQVRRDSIREHKKVWVSVLGGPSYTPEASVGFGGAVLLSFKANKSDTLSYRSFFPMGVNFSVNGTLVVAGAGTVFLNENKFRIYTNYAFRNEPANYYGKGYEEIEKHEMSDSTTGFQKQTIQFSPRFIWSVLQNFYLGTLLDINYSKSSDINPVMAEDQYFNKFKNRYTNIGIGGVVQYDTRDDIATPYKGVFLSATGKLFSRAIGGSYNYQIVDLEYRQFQPLFSRTTLGWVARTINSYGDVPFTELPSFGSPNDLRGYYMGQYRDKSMAYGIVEYRQMFGSQAAYDRGSFWAKLGYVAWLGSGTIGENPTYWDKWKLNYGVGLRAQIQPRKNFRLDIGKAQGTKGMLVYFNMTEAF